MSRRAATRPRKSSPKSDLKGKGPRNHTIPAELGEVNQPRLNSRASMKRWDFGFHPAARTALKPNRTSLSSQDDSATPGYRKISEIKNKIRSRAYRSATGVEMPAGINSFGRSHPAKSFRFYDETNPATDNGLTRHDFINTDVKPPARISAIAEDTGSVEQIDEPRFRMIEPLMKASALPGEAMIEENINADKAETIPDDKAEAIILKTGEPPVKGDSPEKTASDTGKPSKKALKLVRPPETIADVNEKAIITEKTEPAAAADDDQYGREPEEIINADDSNDDKDDEEIDSGLAIEFDLPTDEPMETDNESESEIYAREVTFDLARQITEEAIKIEPDSGVEEDNELESDAPVMETASDHTEAIPQETIEVEADLCAEEVEEEQSQKQQELKGAVEGPRPEMQRPDLKRARRSNSQPWSLDVGIALRDLMGDIADPSKVSLEQMAAAWKRGFDTYFSTSLAETRFPYIWVDVHTVDRNAEGHEKRLVSLVGVNLRGQLKLLALVVEHAENPEFWHEILRDLEKRDLANPRLFIADNRLPLRQILDSVFPRAKIQYCKAALREQILEYFPKDLRNEAGRFLEQIYQADSYRAALESVERFKLKYTDRFPRAVAELVKNRENLLTYYSFPRQHWCAIGQSGRIGNAYPSRALLATVFKYEKFRDFATYLVFNYLLRTQRNWMRLKSVRFLRRVQAGKAYADGRRSRKHESPGIIMPRETRKRGCLTGWFSESIGSILSIFYKRPSSGKMSVFKNAGGKSGPTRMDVVGAKMRPGKNPSSTKTAVGLTGNPKTNSGNGTSAIAKQISKPVSLPADDNRVNVIPAAAEHPSRLVSGLERELLEDLKMEKVSN